MKYVWKDKGLLLYIEAVLVTSSALSVIASLTWLERTPPHDKLPRGRKVFKYALTAVDVASRYKEAEPLTSKESAKVAKAFQKIYKRGPLKWPQLLQVDPGREFMGAVTKEMENHKTTIRRGRFDIHRDQAIVERFNRTLAKRLFDHQYAVEMRLPNDKRSTAWVARLPAVVSALNNEVTRLTDKKSTEAIKDKTVSAKPSTPYSRPVGLTGEKLPSGVNVYGPVEHQSALMYVKGCKVIVKDFLPSEGRACY